VSVRVERARVSIHVNDGDPKAPITAHVVAPDRSQPFIVASLIDDETYCESARLFLSPKRAVELIDALAECVREIDRLTGAKP
jgi:hypothetical protein